MYFMKITDKELFEDLDRDGNYEVLKSVGAIPEPIFMLSNNQPVEVELRYYTDRHLLVLKITGENHKYEYRYKSVNDFIIDELYHVKI